MRHDGAIVLGKELGVVGLIVWRIDWNLICEGDVSGRGGSLLCGHLEAEQNWASWR